MSADRVSLYWIYFIIMSFSAVVCAILAFYKIKIAKREFFIQDNKNGLKSMKKG